MEASRNHIPPPFAQMSAPLTGPWVAPQTLGTVKQESWGERVSPGTTVGCWIRKRKESPPRFYNAITAIISFPVCTVLLEPQIQQREQGILMIPIDQWCPGLPRLCSAYDLVKVIPPASTGTRTQSSLVSKPGAFLWPSRPLAGWTEVMGMALWFDIEEMWATHVFLSCLASWHFAEAFTRSCVWETGSWSLGLIVLSLPLWADRGRSVVGGTPQADSQIPQLSSLAGRLRSPQAEWCSRRLQLRV